MIYNWSELFSQDTFILEKGKDYSVGSVAMAGQVRNSAVRWGIKVSIKEVEEGLIVKVTERKVKVS